MNECLLCVVLVGSDPSMQGFYRNASLCTHPVQIHVVEYEASSISQATVLVDMDLVNIARGKNMCNSSPVEINGVSIQVHLSPRTTPK